MALHNSWCASCAAVVEVVVGRTQCSHRSLRHVVYSIVPSFFFASFTLCYIAFLRGVPLIGHVERVRVLAIGSSKYAPIYASSVSTLRSKPKLVPEGIRNCTKRKGPLVNFGSMHHLKCIRPVGNY